MALESGDRLTLAQTADGVTVATGPVQQPSKAGDRFMLAQTADGTTVPALVTPLTKSGQRGLLVQTADGVTIPVKLGLPPVRCFVASYSDGYVWYIASDGTILQRAYFNDMDTSAYSPGIDGMSLDSELNCYVPMSLEMIKVDVNGKKVWYEDADMGSYSRTNKNEERLYTVSPFGELRKFYYDGSLIWGPNQASYNGYAENMGLDDNSNIYLCGYEKAYKYDSSGSKKWGVKLLDNGYLGAIEPDSERNKVYTTDGDNNLLLKLDGADGAVIWSISFGNIPDNGVIEINENVNNAIGYVYVKGYDSSGYFLEKFDTDGNSYWKRYFDFADFSLGSDGFLYIVSSNNRKVMKYGQDGNKIWQTSVSDDSPISIAAK